MTYSTSFTLLVTITTLVTVCNAQQVGLRGRLGLTDGEGYNKPEFCGSVGSSGRNWSNCFTIAANASDTSNDCSRTNSCIAGIYLHYDSIDSFINVVTFRASNTVFDAQFEDEGQFYGSYYARVDMRKDPAVPWVQFECGHETRTVHVNSSQSAGLLVIERIEVNLGTPGPELICSYYLDTVFIDASSEEFFLRIQYGHHGKVNFDGDKSSEIGIKFIQYASSNDTSTPRPPSPNPGPKPSPQPQPSPTATALPPIPTEVVPDPTAVDTAPSTATSSKTPIMIGLLVVFAIIAAIVAAYLLLLKKPKQKVDMVLKSQPKAEMASSKIQVDPVGLEGVSARNAMGSDLLDVPSTASTSSIRSKMPE